MRLHLLRHGRTAANVRALLDTAYPGAGLDEVGREQARRLIERLDGVPLGALYASDLPRSRQTLVPLSAARGLDVEIIAGLREIAAGDEEMSADWRGYVGVLTRWGAGDLGAALPGGEDGDGFYARYDDAIAKVAAGGHEHALVVSHGAALRLWVGGRARGLDPEEAASRVMGNTARIVIEGEPGDWRFVSWEPGVDTRGPDSDPLDEQA